MIFMNQYIYDEKVSIEEGFKSYVKECFFSEEENKVIEDDQEKEKVFKEKSNVVINKLKDANSYIKSNPDTLLSLKVKTALRMTGYFVATYGGWIALSAISVPAGLVIMGVATAAAKFADPKIREYECKKAYSFYKKEIEWLENKLDNCDDDKERKNINMLLSKYKASASMLKKEIRTEIDAV